MDKVSMPTFTYNNNSSIPLITLYRSLYILKEKFQKYKIETQLVYKKYLINKDIKDNQKYHIIINIESLSTIIQEILTLMNIVIIQLNTANEIFYYNFIPEDQQQKYNSAVIKEIIQYISPQIKKYNKIYYKKRISQKNTLINDISTLKDDITNEVNIVRLDKKGNIIYNNEQLKQINTNNEQMFTNTNQQYTKDITTTSEYEYMLEDNKSIFIETLPIIIADFLQVYSKYTIIDLESSEISDEVKKLFDNKILNEIGNEKESMFKEISKIKLKEDKSTTKELLQEKLNISKNIQFYETLLESKRQKGEMTKHIKATIDKLYKEKKDLDMKIHKREINDIDNKEKLNNNSYLSKSIFTNNIKSDNSISSRKQESKSSGKKVIEYLKDIFSFYTNQHKFFGHSATFESYTIKNESLDISEYIKFCSDFKIDIQRNIVIKIFKNNSNNLKYINFDQFVSSLHSLAVEFVSYKKNILENEINKSNKEIVINYSVDRANKRSLENEYNKLSNMTFKDKLDYLYDYLNIYSPQKYRKNFKGFNPKNYRMNSSSVSNNSILLNKNLISNFEVKQKKKELEYLIQKEKKYYKRLFYFNKRNKEHFKHISEKIRQNSYGNINKKITKLNKEIPVVNKFNWETIEKMDIDNLNLNDKEKEFFLENDNTEDIELLNNLNIKLNNTRSKKLNDCSNVLITQYNDEKQQNNYNIDNKNNINNNSNIVHNLNINNKQNIYNNNDSKQQNIYQSLPVINIKSSNNKNKNWKKRVFGELPNIFSSKDHSNEPLKRELIKSNMSLNNIGSTKKSSGIHKINYVKNEIVNTKEDIINNKIRFIEESNTYIQKVNEKKELLEKLLNSQKVRYIRKFDRDIKKKNIYPILQK